MRFILTALKAEATPLIEYFKLKKEQHKPFSIYQNRDITLIISGIGNINASIASTYLLTKFKLSNDDKIYNIGVCGSKSSKHSIGDIYTIKKIVDQSTNKVVHLPIISNIENENITTFATAQNSTNRLKTNLVDMESFGFYSSAKIFLAKENIIIIKIVSDKIDDTILDKNIIYSLIKNQITKVKSLLL